MNFDSHWGISMITNRLSGELLETASCVMYGAYVQCVMYGAYVQCVMLTEMIVVHVPLFFIITSQ